MNKDVKEKDIKLNTVPSFVSEEIVEEEGDNEESYVFKLKDFEGPLDLLLHLIKQAQVDIRNIFVTQITDQYFAYMQQIHEVDMNKATEFIEMAATLLEIKSHALLPKEEDEEFVDEESPEEQLYRQLEEYNVYKEAADLIKPLETLNRFYREPVYTEKDYKMVINDFSLDKLIDAFVGILHKIDFNKEKEITKKIVKDRFTVEQKLNYVKELLIKQQSLKFFSLFSSDYTRGEVINTFLALLELLKKQIACAEQKEEDGDILITLKTNWTENSAEEETIEQY